MKRVAIGLFAVSVLAATASADMLVVMNTTGSSGSPYTATVASGSEQILGWKTGQTFDTFCLETNEYFYPGHTYRVTSIDNSAINGGVGGAVGGRDTLDIATAWVYDSWLNGSLQSSYTAAQVQNVVWYIEQERSSLSTTEQTLYNAAVAGGAAWNGDFHNIWVMNLAATTSGDFNPAQSQLIRAYSTPRPPPVPAPGAALLGMVGLGMVNWVRRRFA